MCETIAEIGAASTARIAEREPGKLLRRIDRTAYTVLIRFSQTSRETLQDKILRLIERNERNG
jgi:hypothetical protein